MLIGPLNSSQEKLLIGISDKPNLGTLRAQINYFKKGLKFMNLKKNFKRANPSADLDHPLSTKKEERVVKIGYGVENKNNKSESRRRIKNEQDGENRKLESEIKRKKRNRK